MRLLTILLIAFFTANLAHAQTPVSNSESKDGEALFKSLCADCHNGQPDQRAPAPDTLRQRSPEAILEILTNGAMRAQGSRLNGSQRHEIATYLSGKAFGGDPTGASVGKCTSNPTLKMDSASWASWGATERNDRFRSAKDAGLTPEQISHLQIKWSFGFPDATSAWSTPTVAAGSVFVGSQNGTVYSLDAKTGCIHWFFSADGGVRTAITVGARKGGGVNVYFGDTSANAYALDAQTGKQLWKTKVDDHKMARITGSPTLFGDRLYVAMSSYEESQMSNPDYVCCTFRGNVTSIDVANGKIAWHTYVIPQEPKQHGKKPNGAPLFGPSGAAIWSAPTIDATRKQLYVATGNGYTGPISDASDAVIAIELASGKIAWTKQLHENDVYIGNCWTEADELKPECKDKRGPDYDIGNAPILAKLPNGKDILVVGQKSGIGWGINPDKKGEVVWQYRAGAGGALGGMEWGSAVDATNAYFPVSDISTPQPGGLHAVNLQTGERAWFAPPIASKCPQGVRCNPAQAAAPTVIPGAIFSGSNDGMLRAFSTKDGKVLWEVDTNGEYKTVNAVTAKGGSILGPGPTVANGMVFVSSGYGAFGGRPGNVLLAFGVDAKK